MPNNHWLARRERDLAPYRKESWPDRWQRLTGIRPDVVKVRVSHSPCHGSHAYKFREPT